MFERMIEGWFRDYTPHYNTFLKALLPGDLDTVNLYMNRVVLATFSSFDAGVKPSEEAEPEKFYHTYHKTMGLSLLFSRFSKLFLRDFTETSCRSYSPTVSQEMFRNNLEKVLNMRLIYGLL